jgi:hypothetical protein
MRVIIASHHRSGRPKVNADETDGVNRRHRSRDPHFACSRWKATPFELVAEKSWTGMTARPREMSRFLIARGIVVGVAQGSRWVDVHCISARRRTAKLSRGVLLTC